MYCLKTKLKKLVKLVKDNWTNPVAPSLKP